jgi:hypothetical protein
LGSINAGKNLISLTGYKSIDRMAIHVISGIQASSVLVISGHQTKVITRLFFKSNPHEGINELK